MKFNCYLAVTVNAYANFSIEAKNAAAAERTANAMLIAGCFESVPVKVCWETATDERIGGFCLTEGLTDPPVESLEGFTPLPLPLPFRTGKRKRKGGK